jgi:hypothetical protein
MGSARILKEMFLAEATLEFPDLEIAAVTRMIQSNERAGRIPRGATENWPILPGQAGTKGARPTPKATVAKPAAKVASPTPANGDLSGRGIPSTSSLRSGDSAELSHEPPSGLKKFTGGKGAAQGKKADPGKGATGPSGLSRLYSKARGKDPETGLPVPKSASSKVYGGAQQPPPAFREPPQSFTGQAPENQPLFNVPGVTDQPEPTDDPLDPKLATIKKGLSAAKPNLPPRQVPSFPEADVWDRFSGKTGHSEPAQPVQRTQQQGRLSRLFKGRRDDGI